jgi:hypothetical protein
LASHTVGGRKQIAAREELSIALRVCICTPLNGWWNGRLQVSHKHTI